MNKNLIFAVIGGLVAIGLIGSIVLHILRPDTVAAHMPNLITLMGLMITALRAVHGLGKVTEKVEAVRHQTNGTVSALREDNARLNAEVAKLNRQLHPEDGDGR